MVLDTAGRVLFAATLRALAQGGRVATVGDHSGQPTPIKGKAPLPMALCRGLVIAPTLRKGEAVMHASVQLDLTSPASLCEEALQFFDHRLYGCRSSVRSSGGFLRVIKMASD
jgi:NADPH:quinone reductase-like Zn-dependent oxidoreductase